MENISKPTNSKGATRSRRGIMWLAMIALMLVALALVLTPALIIQPFRPQSQQGLELSYILKRWSPIATLFASLAAIALAIWLWSGTRAWWRKSILVVLLLVTFTATWFARQNHFEWMFNPLANSAYARTSEAGSFVGDDDMLMTVVNGNEAAAYPVRQMAYHHVVQDVVGGLPIVATY
jgi:hypothetical protein